MTKFAKLIVAAMLALTSLASVAAADDKTAVRTFYAFLSNPGSTSHADALRGNLAQDWQSIGDYSGKYKTVDAFVGQLSGFAKLIPNLTWEIEEMFQAGDRVIVRGRATGTPNGPLFGVDGEGKSFEIMSIDIHTLEGGKITRTHHVEDWAGALRQLSAQ